MLRYAASFFRPVLCNNDPKLRSSPVGHSGDRSNGRAQVFVWSGDEHNVGHVAIQLDSGPAKCSDDQSSVYASIWPDKYSAVGPLTIVPLHAALASNLASDARLESIKASVEYDSSGDGVWVRRHTGEPIQPDKVFTITKLDKGKMIEEYERIKSGVQSGKVCYQLFPGIKTTSTEVYNCTTLANHILRVGGLTSLPASPSWRPAAFANLLEKQPNTLVQQHDDDNLLQCGASPRL